MSEMKLSSTAFDRAAHFLEHQARPLERARFRHHFAAGSGAAVVAALTPFQNSDGGFGHGLEPDWNSPASSVLATTVALQMLRPLAGPETGAMIEAALGYLLGQFDGATSHWRIIPAASSAAPHAPWWGQDEFPNRFDAFSLNPTAEVVAHLYEFGGAESAELRESVLARVLDHLANASEIEMHDLLCCLRLHEAANLPGAARQQVEAAIGRLAGGTVMTDPAGWSGYGLMPLQLVTAPDSPFMPGLEAAVAANLDHEISNQGEAGAWWPTWAWGEPFAAAWPAARQAWAGMLTLDRLLLLARFGRLERG
ncbi:MAG: hypothetical protein H6651_01030 [Ardenticatenales bacterium]|nr:hypothetical protein [Ardenticatenales bacterium]